jgi:hypothetical protein
MLAPYRVPPKQSLGRASAARSKEIACAVFVVWALSLVRCLLGVFGREGLDAEPILAVAIVAGFAGPVVRSAWRAGRARSWSWRSNRRLTNLPPES